MLAQLGNLIRLYKEFSAKNYVSDYNINLVKKQRDLVYKSITRVDKNNQSLVIEECNALVAYLTQALNSPNITQDTFIRTINMIAKSHTKISQYLDDESKLQVIDTELNAIKSTLYKLKKNPMKAGRRIGMLKDSVKALSNEKSALSTKDTPVG